MDCSAGYDHIPVSYIKAVAEYIASPLTHIINAGISENIFHNQWKIGKITPIPKHDKSFLPDDYRPVTVLPILSKIYERLIAKQICDFITDQNVYKDTMSGFRKHHSTSTILLKIKDDIVIAMERGEVTLSFFSDYSKAFHTLNYKCLISKLLRVGFSKDATKWMISYLSTRYQYVQIDEKSSSKGLVRFGVPQGSILGPVLFNLYVSDLQDEVNNGQTCQYADDTTTYKHCKLSKLNECIEDMNLQLDLLQNWSEKNNLVFNPDKSKIMLFSTQQLSTRHNLDDAFHSITNNNVKIDRVDVWKVLGIHFDQHLDWDIHFNKMLKSAYSKLYQLRKLRRFAPFKLRKHLAESLILSKIDYCNVLFYNAPDYRIKRIQKLIKSAAAFVYGRFATSYDVIKLNWLPAHERISYSIMKLAHKALYVPNFPKYLQLSFNKPKNYDRHGQNINLFVPLSEKTFSGIASRLFNELPNNIRTEQDYETFTSMTKSYLHDYAMANYLNTHSCD